MNDAWRIRTTSLLAHLFAAAALLGACQSGGGGGAIDDATDGGITPTTDGGGSSSGDDAAATSDAAAPDGSDAATTGGILPPGTIACATTLCGAGMKYCAQRHNATGVSGCVSAATPLNGCAEDRCSCFFSHARAACSATGACVMSACDPGWADCDKDPTNGCEVDLRAPANCGTCGNACAQGQLCSPTGCVATCEAPYFTPCGSTCVNLATDARFCGSCSTSCVDDFPTTNLRTCQAGTCSVPSCAPGYTSCGPGCTDLQIDAANCGACGKRCAATETCVAGVCKDACRLGSLPCGSSCAEIWIDPKNCGACGNVCGDGQSCVHGTCAPTTSLWIATGSRPEDIVLDATHVYVSDLVDGTVRAIPKAGGPGVTLATSQPNPRRLALDATHVYWTNELGSAVMRAPKDGSALPEVVSSANTPWGIVVDDAYVYWAEKGTETIRKAPKTGGAAETVFPTGISFPPWTEELSTDGVHLFSLVRRSGYITSYVTAFDKVGGTYQVLLNAALSPPVLVQGGNIVYRSKTYDILAGPPFPDGTPRPPLWCPELALLSTNTCAVFGLGQVVTTSYGLMGNLNNHTVRPAIPSSTVVRIAADDANIYWTDKSSVGKIPLP